MASFLSHNQTELVVILKVWNLNCTSGKEMTWSRQQERLKTKNKQNTPEIIMLLRKHTCYEIQHGNASVECETALNSAQSI